MDTQGIINSIKTRDQLKKKINHNKNNKELIDKYKKYRNKLNKIIQNTKFNYYKNELEGDGLNCKKIWDIVKGATNIKTKCKKNVNIEDERGLIITNDIEKAELFNKYFLNIGENMAKKIDNSSNKFKINKDNVPQSFFLKPVEENEIVLCIGSLKNKCSPGLDGISTTLLKKFHQYIIAPLKHIINRIFLTGIVPSHFKESVIVPVYKTGEETKINNYRPITLINNIAKIFEKCLKKRLVNYLEQFNLLSHNQFGFRAKKNAEGAIHQVINFINNKLNENKKCVAIFLDLAKAFDTVSHQILTDRMQSIGIRGIPLNILTNYLHNRKQYVKIKDTLSQPLITKLGVPQGTVLGPILFLIYINSLYLINNFDGNIVSFADDTVLLFSEDSWELAIRKASIGLSTVRMWLDKNLLSLNYQKTNYIAFSTTSVGDCQINNIKIHDNLCINGNYLNCICNETIKLVDDIKYLGVVVDKHLRWGKHIKHITTKIRSLIPVFYQLRNIFKQKELTAIYKALVESLLRYSVINWGGLYDNALKMLKVSQNYIVRVIFKKDKRYNTDLLYNDTNLLNVKMIYIIQSINFIHFNPKKSAVHHSHSTRAIYKNELETVLYRKTLCQRFVTYLGPKYYNKIPVQIRNIKNKKKFCREVQIFVTQNKNLFIYI